MKNRSVDVADEYQKLCSNQWADAKKVLDKVCGDKTLDYMKIQLLSEVLMVSSMNLLQLLFNCVNISVENIIFSPFLLKQNG